MKEEAGTCCEKAFILNNLKKIELQGPEMSLEHDAGWKEGSGAGGGNAHSLPGDGAGDPMPGRHRPSRGRATSWALC